MGKVIAEKSSTKPGKPNNARPVIFSYHDYRTFLRDWLAFLKSGQSRLSLRQLAKAAELSPSLITMILSGSRKLSRDHLPKLGPALKLDAEELAYFEILVSLGNASTQSHRTESYRRLCEFRKFRDLNPNEFEVFKYLTHWYYVAIREMSALPDFSADTNWIHERLRYGVEPKEIERALGFLRKHGHIEEDSGGKTLPPKRAIDCMGGVYKLALTQFHKEMFALAAKSIDSVESENRNILGYTLLVDEEKLPRIRKTLDDAHAEIRAIAQEPAKKKNELSACDIFHVQLALFPLTKKP